jgi:hypothetical protein
MIQLFEAVRIKLFGSTGNRCAVGEFQCASGGECVAEVF